LTFCRRRITTEFRCEGTYQSRSQTIAGDIGKTKIKRKSLSINESDEESSDEFSTKWSQERPPLLNRGKTSKEDSEAPSTWSDQGQLAPRQFNSQAKRQDDESCRCGRGCAAGEGCRFVDLILECLHKLVEEGNHS
jgi:hypothetical protein